MKKLLVVLLSLGLIVALSTAASAVDVKFSGGYYVVGVYDNNPELRDTGAYSRAAFFQRVRVQTVFQVAEGLSMTTRFDALEKQWGQTDWRSATIGASSLSSRTDQDKANSRPAISQTAGRSVQENLELERGFITFMTAAGQFDVGYQAADQWGTVFGNSESTRPRAKFSTKAGPVSMLLVYEKVFEADSSAATNVLGTAYAGRTDADADNYFIAGIYNFKGGETGLLYKYVADSRPRAITATPYKTQVMGLSPYFKATFGPVYLEGEMTYAFGKAAKFDDGIPGVSGNDIDMSSWNAYVLAKMNVGPAYFGGQIGWVQGDGDDATKNTTGSDGGYDWKPTLILNNVDYATWIPGGKDSGNSYKNDPKGFFLYNVFGGFNPTPKLNLEASLSVASYDTKKQWNATRTAQTELISDKIGTEFDITATYKIYDNLTYMVGGGYIFTGDAWKGNVGSTATVGNNYMLLNKLTLSF